MADLGESMGSSRLRRFAIAVVIIGTVAVAPGAGAAKDEAGAARVSVQVVSLATNDLVYDPVERVILASVPSRQGPSGNSVTAINPRTGTIRDSVFVGSEPTKLSLSDDASTLWIGLSGAAAVRKFDTTTFTAGIQFPLGRDPFYGPLFPEDIDAVPGSNTSVAASVQNACCSPRHGGVAIYDDGVRRPTMTPGHTGSNVIEFSDSASVLYGYNNETTEFGFRTMDVSESGVTVVKTVGELISGFDVDFEFDHGNDLVYATTGRVIDPAASLLVGTIGASGPVEPDSTHGLVFYLTGSTLRAFDADTFVPLGSLKINGMVGSPSSLIRWGRAGLAFRTSGDQVFIIRPSRGTFGN